MFHIIVNPSSHSGQGYSSWLSLKRVLDAKKATYIVHFTKSAKDTYQYTRSITDKRLFEHNATENHILVLGGDGTLNCVVNGIDDVSHTNISYLPTGTSNDFARAMHIPQDITNIADLMRQKGKPVKSDIGLVSYKKGKKSRRFAVSCGIGFDAAICQEVARSPFKKALNAIGLGKIVYPFVAVRQFLALRPAACELYVDDQPAMKLDRFWLCTFMQQPCEGGGFHFCPSADNTDGLMDICLVGNVSKLQLLPIIPALIAGKHVDKNGVYMFRGQKARIVTSRPMCTHTDGEVIGYHQQLSFETEADPLNIKL